MTDAKIKELEGQVLALRWALTDAADALDIYTVNYAPAARKALTDTAQAGKEARARILAELAAWMDEAADEIEGWGGYASEYFQDKHDLAVDVKRFRDRANRLRNGGSDA